MKDEGRLPTGSFKARGLAMAVSMAKQFGIKSVALPTNGNAGAALAAYAARAGMEAVVVCPAETPEINVRETAAYGARVWVADGQIDECGRLVREGAAEGRWFDCSTLKEPYRLEGKKVMGFELVEQLGWKVPDAIFYPTGGGTGLIGMWKAFDELEAVGLIGPERPRMYAIQAAGCAPMVRAFERGDEFAERWEGAATVATGIRVPSAVGDFLILRAVRESGGAAIAVEEQDIVQAVEDVARDDGFLLCPGRWSGRRGMARRAGSRPGHARRDGAAVQLRKREQVSAGGCVAAAGVGDRERRHALGAENPASRSCPAAAALDAENPANRSWRGPMFHLWNTTIERSLATVVPAGWPENRQGRNQLWISRRSGPFGSRATTSTASIRGCPCFFAGSRNSGPTSSAFRS